MNRRTVQALLLESAPVLAALLPLAACLGSFRDLYFFGDDWEHISRMQSQGLWTSSWAVFAENFVPVFRFAWCGLLRLSGGSHFALVLGLWVSHAAVIFFMDRLLRQIDIGWIGRLAACMVTALTSINIETLGWTTQWTTVLSAGFTLAAFWWWYREDPLQAPWSLHVHGVLVILVTASAWSVSRGVLAGAVLALASLWPSASPTASWPRRLSVAAMLIAPCLLTATIITVYASGNHHAMAEHIGAMTRFGGWYYAVNPLHRLLGVDSFGWRTTLLLGAIKITVVAWALLRSRGPAQAAFAMLTLLDLAGAALVGIGRYHTGIGAIISSRYQYFPLISFMPLAGFVFAEALDRCVAENFVRRTAATVAIVGAGWLVAADWPEEMRLWSQHRGRETRLLVLDRSQPAPKRGLPGIPGIDVARGRELADRFNLH